MTERCKHGDIAIVIKEEPGCEQNLGRLVHVSGPSAHDLVNGLSWIIRPVCMEEPWLFIERDGTLQFMNLNDYDIEHPDAWLLPLKPQQSDEFVEETRELEIHD